MSYYIPSYSHHHPTISRHRLKSKQLPATPAARRFCHCPTHRWPRRTRRAAETTPGPRPWGLESSWDPASNQGYQSCLDGSWDLGKCAIIHNLVSFIVFWPIPNQLTSPWANSSSFIAIATLKKIDVWMYGCMYVCMYVCMFANMHVWNAM